MEGVSEIKRRPTYYTELLKNQTNSGGIVMTPSMSEVADVCSYDDRPDEVKKHSGGGEKGPRNF